MFSDLLAKKFRNANLKALKAYFKSLEKANDPKTTAAEGNTK